MPKAISASLFRRRFLRASVVRALLLCSLGLLVWSVPYIARTWAGPVAAHARTRAQATARLSPQVSVRAAGRGTPFVQLSDGHELLTAYDGPTALQAVLASNNAQPLALAAADFDEDGVPDLVAGYATGTNGVITLLRGNADAIYPHAPAAQQHRTQGTYTAAPFLAPARVFALDRAPDFLGAGDFDADGHWDVVAARRGGDTLVLLVGDGRGQLSYAREVQLPGAVTTLTTGEINRADGLTDVVVGIALGKRAAQVLVYEGPEGALRAAPEVLPVTAPATALTLGQLDDSYEMDLAVGAGTQLLVVHGRDRKLSLDAEHRRQVQPARIEARMFSAAISALAVGDFNATHAPALALLTTAGQVEVLSPTGSARTQAAPLAAWTHRRVGRAGARTTQLVRAKVSSLPGDDLLVLDTGAQLRVLSGAARADAAHAINLAPTSAPVAVLPMRLNGDALSDLVVLTGGTSAPSVVLTQPQATFVVTNTNSTGPGSLQFAILDANETPGADTITFNIPGPGPFKIKPTAALPTITDPVTIDGTTQLGFQGTPIIELDGSLAGLGPNGLSFAAGGSVVRSLSISGFRGNSNMEGAAIKFNSSNNLVEGNILGNSSTARQGNTAGVVVEGAANNTVGGTTVAARNVISTNIIGINLTVTNTSDVTGNNVQGNSIVNNGQAGVSIFTFMGVAGTANVIGGTVAGARNIISGNSTAAITVAGRGDLIQGNFIGTDATGTAVAAGPVGLFGISILTQVSTIGGTTPAARNVIAGHSQFGVRVEGGTNVNTEIRANLVQGNYIGVGVNGNGNLGNGEQGVLVNTFNPGSTIGGAIAGAGNVIANNRLNGIVITGGLGGHTVQGNLIGTDATGTVDLGNVQNGIYILNSPNNTIGGTAAGGRNIISGNGLSGVLIEGAQATGNVVVGNFIGTNTAGTGALGNDLNGVTTSQAPNNTIGGAVVAARNIISASGRHGVSIGIDTNSGATGVTVQNNYIGTDASGNNCLGNLRDGVFVNRGSVTHTITENLIACNGRNGVNIPNFATGDAGIQIQVVANSIYGNAMLGIDLGDAGITANDPQDTDGGANLQQNFPVLTSFGNPFTAPAAGRTPRAPLATLTINGTLNSAPNTSYTVHWYFSATQPCTNNQAPSLPLAFGKVQGVATDGSGNATFSFPFTFPGATTAGIINTTATDPQGNTSEFSACFPVNAASTLSINTVTPAAGRTAGGQQVTFTGTFSNLSAVMIGGVAATINSSSATQVVITTPAHAVNAVQIDLTPTSGSTYTKQNAFAYLPTVFTDNTLIAGVTTAQAQHILELRQAVDALRAVAGLAPATWTDAALAPGGTIKAIHIMELRQRLEEAAAALGFVPGTYTDPSLSVGTQINRVHIEELRQRIRSIAG